MLKFAHSGVLLSGVHFVIGVTSVKSVAECPFEQFVYSKDS